MRRICAAQGKRGFTDEEEHFLRSRSSKGFYSHGKEIIRGGCRRKFGTIFRYKITYSKQTIARRKIRKIFCLATLSNRRSKRKKQSKRGI